VSDYASGLTLIKSLLMADCSFHCFQHQQVPLLLTFQCTQVAKHLADSITIAMAALTSYDEQQQSPIDSTRLIRPADL
jgi:hypothetical protein